MSPCFITVDRRAIDRVVRFFTTPPEGVGEGGVKMEALRHAVRRCRLTSG